MQTVGIVGLGALGVLFGQRLLENGADVRVIADEARAERYQKQGVICNGTPVNFRYETPKTEKPVDLMIFATKESGLRGAMETASGFIGENTLMLSVLNGESSEVGMYLAMSRQADREGYPEIAEAYKRYAWEEAEHAAKFAELLGDVVWDTKTNLKKRMEAEAGACEDKKRIATLAKQQNLDAIHDTVHEMCKDEARHGKGFEGLYNRYFK